MKTAIGILNVKTEKECSICGHKRRFTYKKLVEKEEDLNGCREALAKKVNKEYTCNICKSILKD